MRIHHIIITMLLTLAAITSRADDTNTDSLLRVLDRELGMRDDYLQMRLTDINRIKTEKSKCGRVSDIIDKNQMLNSMYQTLVCDSAKVFLRENMRLADSIGDVIKKVENEMSLATVYSMSGEFVSADEILREIDYASLPGAQRGLYAYSRIKYYENMAKNSTERSVRDEYMQMMYQWRDTVMNMWSANSDEYRKEVAAILQSKGEHDKAVPILLDVISRANEDTHEYGMLSMALAKAYEASGDNETAKHYLIKAAITDTRLGIKENEALLHLSEMLYGEKDIDRAFTYMQYALEDANYYNSRFKNSLIASVFPQVEESYINQIREEQHRAVFAIITMSIFALALLGTVVMLYRKNSLVSKQRQALDEVNKRMARVNDKLKESNTIKEQYVGYFMQQCSIYISKLDEFRKNTVRKIKSNQVKDLYVTASRPLEKEISDLYLNFDNAFLHLYPNFVDEFNSLLKPEEHITTEYGRLNIVLRIFALRRLGITDMGQIANFLHVSVQTIYNYRSKVKKASLLEAEEFEHKVKSIGTMITASED